MQLTSLFTFTLALIPNGALALFEGENGCLVTVNEKKKSFFSKSKPLGIGCVPRGNGAGPVNANGPNGVMITLNVSADKHCKATLEPGSQLPENAELNSGEQCNLNDRSSGP
ncbi:hypothetical protein PspLS_11070 [Pyricularia sp. CBS 133598]|nr:hypothetical protein PspLS_11070 [Pyricularia sp. CBS 133598]